MKIIEFSYNWNNKLNCKSFSTVRIANPKKYVLIDEYEVILKTKGNGPDIHKGLARLQVIQFFKLFEVSPAITFIDANLSVIDFQKLVLKMYKNSSFDPRNQYMCFLVFQYLTINEPEKQLALSAEFQK